MSSETPLSPDTSGQPVILVVDDEEMIRNLVRIFLQGEGYSVLAAYDGQEALELSRKYSGPIDLLITGVEMPRLNGLDLCAQLLKERPQIKVIVMTGSDKTDITYPILLKPPNGETLLAKVEEVLTAPGQSSMPHQRIANASAEKGMESPAETHPDSTNATHEAAHIIAALILDVRVSGATLFSSPDPSGHPRFEDEWAKRLKETNDLEGYKAYCVILLAPYFVELNSERITGFSLDDRILFEEIVEEHFPNRRRVLIARAKRIVRDRYNEIVRLAELLTERKKLCAEDIEKFWNERSKK